MKEIRRKPRYQVARKNEGIFKGRVFVKRANMWLEYECYNMLNKPDKFVWI